jgi:hypothetical protein
MKKLFSGRKFLFSLFASVFVLSIVFPAIAPAAATAFKWATVPTVFTCADLLVSQAKAEEIWADSAESAQYMPNSETVQAIVANQTAKLAPITGLQDKDRTIKIVWLTSCELEIQDCTTDCFPTGNEIKADCKEYAPTICREVPVWINETNLRSSIYTKEEVLARAMLKAIKLIEEDLAAKGVAFLEDVEGVNTHPGDYGTVVGAVEGASYTKIAPANWTAALVGYFLQASRMNRFASPYAISGNNLQQAIWNAEAEYANADGKGNLNKFNQLKFWFDPWNVDAAFPSPLTTFLLDRSAVAFGGKWEYPEQVADFGGNIGKRYSIASKTIPGLRYDVHYLMDCSSREIIHKFNIIARAGFYLNPTGCTASNTGVLRFTKEA